MTKVVVIAQNVSSPLYKHRSKEFSKRMYFMAKQFDEIHILSKEKNFKGTVPSVKDELFPNLILHKIHDNLIYSNIEVLKIVRNLNADIVFADGIGHGASSLFCKRHGIPLVIFVQGYEADLKAIELKLRLGLKPIPGFLSTLFAMYDAPVLRSSDRILCVSKELIEYTQSLLGMKHNAKKITFIPHSLQYVKKISKKSKMWADKMVHFIEANHGHHQSLLMVVGIGSAKGTEIALKALKYIVTKCPHIVMILVGKTIKPRYFELVNRLRLRSNVLFLENLPRDKVVALLLHCSVFLLPSFSEGFSFAMCEAMALGVPVVTFANKSVKNLAKEEAVFAVSTTNPQDYARACIIMLRDETRRQKVVDKADEFIFPYVNLSENARFKMIHSSISAVLNNRLS